MLLPFGDRVLVSIEDQQKSPGGIIMVSTSEERYVSGKVVSVGDGENVRNIPVGSIVIFDKMPSVKLLDNGETFWSVNFASLQARIS